MKSRILSILKVGLLPALFIAPALQAAPVIAEQLLIDNGSSGQGGNVIGHSVAIDGEWAFVGAGEGQGQDFCQVYIYKFDYSTGLWGDGGGAVAIPGPVTAGKPYSQLRGQGSCNTASFGGFGNSVSTSNGLLAVGAPLAKDGGNIRHGKIFFYKYDPAQIGNGTGGWVQDAAVGFPKKFVNSVEVNDLQSGAAFGTVVSVRYNAGDDTAILLAGAPLYNTNNGIDLNTGKAYFYKYNGATNTVTFINSVIGKSAADRYGASVTSNGALALVGAPFADTVGVNNGEAYVYNFGVNAEDPINEQQAISAGMGGGLTLDSHNLGISVSLSPSPNSVMLLGGDGGASANGGAYILKDDNNNGQYAFVTQTTGTEGGDVSQDGNVAGFGYNGQFTALHFDNQNVNPASPDWIFFKTETEYGRDISLDGARVMVNGNGNTTEGTNEGIAYAYYNACGAGGELVANEWTMVGVQCNVLADGSPATARQYFSDLAGTYGTNWIMYKQNGMDYEGHQNAYTPVLSNEVLVPGQGYWIIADASQKWQVVNPGENGVVITATPTITVADPNSGQPSRAHLAAVHATDVKSMLSGLTLPMVPDSNEDTRVMFSNPFLVPMEWVHALMGENSYQNVGSFTSIFEGGDTSAYIYNPATNGYTAINPTPGFSTLIKPGQGFFIKLSDTFHTGVLNDPNIIFFNLMLPLAK